MVRTRIPEASLVGLLAALATFCALEARGGQPYSIVGQSGRATAATGRRPLAERIKAANRPIRITSEEELAPDEGLIPALRDPATEVREWTPGPAVVEFPAGGPAAIAVDEPAETDEPGVLPPPESTAVAAHPTTADDAGLPGEVSAIDSEESADEGPSDGTTEASPPVAAGSVAAPGRLPQAPKQAARVAPPRRSAARVTPQRREALLDRLRTALADVPRPLGLVPAPSRPKTASRQPAATPRAAVVRRPVPATSLPEPLTAQSAATPTGASLEANAPTDEAGTAEVEATTSEPTLATVEEPAPEGGAPSVSDESGDDALAEASADTESPPPSTEPASELAVGELAEEPLESIAVAEATAATGTDPLETAAKAAVAETPAVRPVVEGQPRRQVHRHGARVPSAPQPAMTPLDRLQARLENMPRALGLVPAPRPSMHAHKPPRQRVPRAAPAPVTQQVEVAAPTPVVESAPAAVAAGDTIDRSAAPTTETLETDLDQEENVDAVPSLAGDAPPPEELLSTADNDRASIAATDDAGEAMPAEAADESDESQAAVDPALSTEASTLVATTAGETAIPTTEPTPVKATAPPAAARQNTPRQPVRRSPAPIVRRPIRDALESALANMPRPLGLLPQSEPVAARRSGTGTATGGSTPRALATKSIGTRPLGAESGTEPGISRANLNAPPTDSGADAEDTTLTSGNATAESEPISPPNDPSVTDTDIAADAAAAPATLADLPDERNVTEVPAASIEVKVAGPESPIPLGERVTLRLTVCNTGTTTATAVTPVVHFGVGLEPLGIRGRHGSFTPDGSVMFDRLAELPAGESVEVEIVAVCTGAGKILYQGAAWCGDGDERSIVPADGSLMVAPPTIAAEPAPLRHR